MEDILIDLGNSVSIDTSDVFVGADQDIVSESEALVGPPGPPGPQGPAGRDGVDGQAATVTVGSTTTTSPGTNANVTNSGTSSAAVLNFSIPRGNQGEAATVTVGSTTTGAAGTPASVTNSGTSSDAILDFTIPQGVAGNAATITVGSVQTVAPEYPATVTNSGTTSAAVLDFNIPQGIQGAQGVPGQDGQDGAPGQAATVTVGSTTTGAAGTNASVTNSGTTSAAILDFTIPRGAAGQDGQDGAPGAAATIAVGTTSTGAAGSSASVTNSGTSSAAVFDFVIPKGDTGAAGQDGAPGAAATITVGSTTTGTPGTLATVTNSGTSSAAVLDFTIPAGFTPILTAGTTTTGNPGTNASVTRTGSDIMPIFNFTIPRGDTGATGPAGQGFVDYSTSEVNTGIKWVDGSTLYRKVINFGALPNASQKSVAHGVSGIRIHSLSGIARNPNSGITFILPTLSTSFGACITMYADSTNIHINTQSTDRSAYTECYVILEYTKAS